ncbi:Protein F44E2.4 [Aphelenchoides avenae]|nr:Protein F44E2.4 [Aphelenchus avenae]
MISQLCSSRNIFDEHRVCLNQAVQSAKGKECLAKYHRDEENKSYCTALSSTADCLASKINSDCGADALSFVYNAMNTYVHELSADSKCALSVPSVSLETGCSEQHLIQYLECETIVDKFRFRPVTFVSNASKWDEFCSTVTDKYRPCLDNLECKFEPVSTASLTLFENLCEREVTRRDQRTNAECLAKVADSETGKKCLDAFNGVDLLARDAGTKLCDSVNAILRCMANDIELQCGGEALLHVYDIHYTWVHAFNSTCSLAPENNKAPTKEQDKPIVSPTEAPSSTRTTAIEENVQKTTNAVQNAHAEETPRPEPHPEPEPVPEPTPEPTPVSEETTAMHAHDHNELPTEKPDDTKGNGSGSSRIAAYWKTLLAIATLLIFTQCYF